MQHDAIFGMHKAVCRTHRHTRCIGTVHASHGNRVFTRFTIVERNYAATLDAPFQRIIVFIFTGRDTAVTFDTAFGVTQEFHSCHG
ncbi:Uncharacterised protein [Vibrio cholerae]|uniref:Uncharacterized protein n=1 Tax=Vibrio cholerae TaxID=666 RepID=A0A655WZD3_VIBCL|nr:Uncharacterised protein [Vibrio cholerae]